jgi:hypothetical protein
MFGSTTIRDLVGMVGAALISWGAGMIYLPAGLIVGGSLLVIGSVLHAMNAK